VSNIRKKWDEIWPDNPFPSAKQMGDIVRKQEREREEREREAERVKQKLLAEDGEGDRVEKVEKPSKKARKLEQKGAKKPKGRVNLLDFLQAVAGDCCSVTEGPGTELLLVPTAAVRAQVEAKIANAAVGAS
jgi:hypothetical protein